MKVILMLMHMCLLTYISLIIIDARYVNVRDGMTFIRRGRLESTNDAIDFAQARMGETKQKIDAVGKVMKERLGQNSLVKDLHTILTSTEKITKRELHLKKRNFQYLGGFFKRSVNGMIDYAQDRVSRLGNKTKAIGGVIKNHAKKPAIIQDFHQALHEAGGNHVEIPHHRKRDLSMMFKREAISIDSVLNPSQKVNKIHFGKRDQSRLHKRSLNDKIDGLQAKATGLHEKGHALKDVLKSHTTQSAFAKDLKNAWHGLDKGAAEDHEHHHKRNLVLSNNFMIKRDLIDATNKAIDNSQQKATLAFDKVEAVGKVVDDHVMNNFFVKDVESAWNHPNGQHQKRDLSDDDEEYYIKLVRRTPGKDTGLKRAASVVAEEAGKSKVLKSIQRTISKQASSISHSPPSPHSTHTPHLSRTPSSSSFGSSSHHTEFTRGRSMNRSPTLQRSLSEPVRGSKASNGGVGLHMPKGAARTGAVATAAAIVGAAAANINIQPPSLTLNLQHAGRGRQLSMNTDLSEGMVNSNFNLGGTNVQMNRMTRARSFGNGGGYGGGGMGGYAQEVY